jgi:hypothetical protein
MPGHIIILSFRIIFKLTARGFCLTFLIFLAGCTKSSVTSKDDLKHPDSSFLPVIFLCGQSNMEGVPMDSSVPQEFKETIQNAYVFYKPTNTAINDGNIELLSFGVNNNWRTPKRFFGPEAGIARFLTDQGHRVAIVKYAYGGSKLSFIGSPCTYGYWQSDATDSLDHFSILINDWAIPAMHAFKKAGLKPYIAAFIWCQGETDCHDGAAANVYEKNFENLLDNFKTALIPEDSLVSNMRVIITRTRNGYPFSKKVRGAQVSVANNYHNAYWIDSDSWPLLPDNVHFTPDAQATMQGKAIADILTKVIP